MVIGEKIGAKTAEKYSFVFTFSYPEVRVVFDGNFRMHRFLQKCQAKYLTMWMSSFTLKYSFEFPLSKTVKKITVGQKI